MKLKELLTGISVLECTADPELKIKEIFYDSRKVTPGSLFVAVSGFAADGNKFIPMAAEKGAAAVLSPSSMKSWSWQQDQAGTYTGGEFTYTSPATEKEIKVTVGKGSRILKQSGKADSKADAERKIKAAVAKANHGKTKLSATIVGNASLVASQCVQVVGLGKLSGKYYIDTITHNVSGSGGYTMDLEMSLVKE